MIMNILAIAILGGVAYAWGAKGGFSSLLNCICVVLAGAIAFALWEPTANLLIENAGKTGFSSLLADIAWGAGLALPFALGLGMLRAATDGLIRKNLKFSPAGDWIVGSIFGVISGVIVSGICVLTLSGMRIGTDAWGYTALESDNSGNIQRGSNLFVPTDRITAALYSRLSTGSFSSSDPLAQWNPDPAVFLASARHSYAEGTGRTAVDSKDFSLLGRYVLDPAKLKAPAPAKPGTAPATPGDPNDLKADASDPTPQGVKYFDGSSPAANAKLYGFILRFKPGAKERTSGQVVNGNGQIYVIAENAAGERQFFFPNAVVIKAEAGKVGIARFRYDAKDTYLASLGGDSESNWAFEFLIPADFEPIAIVTKGARIRLDPASEALKPVEFDSRAKRDALILAGQLTSGKGGGTIDDSKAIQVTITENTPGAASYSNMIGPVLQDGTLGSSITVTNGRIVSGRATLSAKDLQNRGVDQNLRVDRYAVPDSVGIFQVDVSVEQGEAGMTGSAARTAMNNASVPATPFIVDTNGIRYDAVGYFYQDPQKAEIRFSIGEPIQDVGKEVPAVSVSQPGRKLKLIFAPSVGTHIAGWGIGNTLVAKYVPPIDATTQQR
ncbi:MAG: hypothetical protein U0573_13995 [Phycisphaerales bacterium]|nr:CvpA family protein [Planctomycetota bacterium]